MYQTIHMNMKIYLIQIQHVFLGIKIFVLLYFILKSFWIIRRLIIRSTFLTPITTTSKIKVKDQIVVLVFMLTGLGMGDKCRLPPGQHFYPFSFQLPSRLPSSFEGGDGYVRYTIRGVIDRSSWIKKDKDTKKPFTVIALLDLNTYPNSAVRTNQ